MDSIKVLITGAGAPGIKGTLYSLKENFDRRKIFTVGTDIKNYVVGKYLCDKFYQISRPSTPEYLEQLSTICEKENIDVILPQNTAELLVLAKHKNDFEKIGTKIAISDEMSIKIANNKYELMKIAKEINVPVPQFYLVEKFDDLVEYSKKLGWPENPVVVKPPISNGMRGLRIINENIDAKKMFYEEKPTGVYIKMGDLEKILGEHFPPLIISEYLPKDEYTVDILRGNDITIVPRRRDMIRSGITFIGTVEKREDIIEYSEKLSHKIGLKYAFGFQFKLNTDNIPSLLECNPRIQGTMVLSTIAGANIIYGAVKIALGEDMPNFRIKWGARLLRYWGGIGIADKVVEI